MSKYKQGDTFNTSFGELMDIANADNYTELKDFLRKAFQEYCNMENKAPFNAETVMDWRNTRVIMTRGKTDEWKVEYTK